MRDQEGILLESGTNEVEVLEFQLAGQGFGVNVLKVQAIEQFDIAKVTEIQLAHESVIGTYNYRDGVITLVDLSHALAVEAAAVLPPEDAAAVAAVVEAMPTDRTAERPAQEAPAADAAGAKPEDIETRIVLVLEFNEQTTGFLVGGVNRIHRVSWNAISPISPYLASAQTKFTGSLNIEKREILMVDMERILADIIPSTGDAYSLDRAHESSRAGASRADIPILLAEDSPTIRSIVTALLNRGGYEIVHAFDNGQSCFEAIQGFKQQAEKEGRPIHDFVGALVSDIEMPLMDGMTLCRRTKNDLGLRSTPVILFSSLINEQIARKCESVGADGYISKPKFSDLMDLVDKHCLTQPTTA
ncbi:MAG: chemotaxis protein [Candidatus Krumholzibacteriia bacterium]